MTDWQLIDEDVVDYTGIFEDGVWYVFRSLFRPNSFYIGCWDETCGIWRGDYDTCFGVTDITHYIKITEPTS